jgi:hypothetical protein
VAQAKPEPLLIARHLIEQGKMRIYTEHGHKLRFLESKKAQFVPAGSIIQRIAIVR